MKKTEIPYSITSLGAGRYEVPRFGKIIAPIPSNVYDFWDILYKRAYQDGVRAGKMIRSEEFKKLINNE